MEYPKHMGQSVAHWDIRARVSFKTIQLKATPFCQVHKSGAPSSLLRFLFQQHLSGQVWGSGNACRGLLSTHC